MTVATYQTLADKTALFPALIVPATLAAARAGAQSPALAAWLECNRVTLAPWGMAQAMAIHEAARAGLYRPTVPTNCDVVQAVETTLRRGGDCDQWAAVVLAALAMLGYPDCQLATFGDDRDPYQHVAVLANVGNQYAVLDPKGDQQGREFASPDPGWRMTRTWRL